MKYAVLDYEMVNGFFNIGDYVQSLAAAQYFPFVDEYISRERLDAYSGERVKMILNGWFMHEPINWPPASAIDPLFVSFHINRPYLDKMLSRKSIEYLKKHEPIGCRDYHTAEQLKRHGVDAYYSGCLTLTLGNNLQEVNVEDRKGILFVDVMHAVPNVSEYGRLPVRYLASHIRSGSFLKSARKKKWIEDICKIIPNEVRDEVSFIRNSIEGRNLDTGARFKMAGDYLDKLKSARLVFTSRIHCALPCLAYGTPVIFVKAGQKSESNILRFKGIIDHMNVLDYDGDLDKHGFTSNKISLSEVDIYSPPLNPRTFKELADSLSARCNSFVRPCS